MRGTSTAIALGKERRLLCKPPERACIVVPIYSAFRRCCVSNPDLTSACVLLIASKTFIVISNLSHNEKG